MNKPQLITPLPLSAGANVAPPQKRLFMGLVVVITGFFCLLFFLFWLVPYIGLRNIHPALPFVVGIIFAGLTGTIAWAALALALQSVRGRPFKGADRIRAWGIKFFLPLAELLGKLLGYTIDEVRRSFIKVNNELTLSYAHLFKASQILILLPHCIQRVQCSLRLTYSVDHCRRCGACPLGGLLTLRDKYGVKLAVATGGSVARLIVVENKPRLIIAVACERDLSSGIQDTYPLPVYGVLNERPEGPCKNTKVSLEFLEKVLLQFLDVQEQDLR